jgi:hypothetical protein
MPFKQTTAIYCENNMKHTDTLCEQIAEIFNLKGGLYIQTFCIGAATLCGFWHPPQVLEVL